MECVQQHGHMDEHAMKITQNFRFHFEIGASKYDFNHDAETLDEAKAKLADELRVMLAQLGAPAQLTELKVAVK